MVIVDVRASIKRLLIPSICLFIMLLSSCTQQPTVQKPTPTPSLVFDFVFVLLASRKQAPSITAGELNTIFSANDSPVHDEGTDFVTIGMQEHIQPLFLAALFRATSQFATRGLDGISAARLHTLTFAPSRTGGVYQAYASWKAGIQAAARLLYDLYYRQEGYGTVRQLVPVFFPSSNGWNDACMITSLLQAISVWMHGMYSYKLAFMKCSPSMG